MLLNDCKTKQWDTFLCKPLHNAPEEIQSERNQVTIQLHHAVSHLGEM